MVSEDQSVAHASSELIISGSVCSWSRSFLEKKLLLPGETPLHTMPLTVLAMNLNTTNTVERTINGKTSTQTVGPGRTCLYTPGTELKVRWRRTHTIVFLGIEEKLLDMAGHDLYKAKSTDLVTVPDFKDGEIVSLMQRLIKESDSQGGSTLAADSLSSLLAIHLLRYYSENKNVDETVEKFSARQTHQISEFMQEHYRDNLSLLDLSEIFEISPYHFLRKFRMTFGLPPHQWMLRRKIGEACELISNSDLNINEIAYTVGFRSASHFARTFKNIVGCAPSKYKLMR